MERSTLERRRRRGLIAQADATRAEIVLLTADVYINSAIARAIGVTGKSVQSWRGRFAVGVEMPIAEHPLHCFRTRSFSRIWLPPQVMTPSRLSG